MNTFLVMLPQTTANYWLGFFQVSVVEGVIEEGRRVIEGKITTVMEGVTRV
jgi:hypothetical protein